MNSYITLKMLIKGCYELPHKALFSFVITSIACLIFGFGILLIELEYSTFSREQNKALTVATTTAALLDVNQVKALIANPIQNNLYMTIFVCN